MKLRIEPISAIIISIILSYAWNQATSKPICYVHETIDGEVVEVPYLCEDVLKQ